MSIPSSSHFSFQCIKPAKGWCCWTCHLESSKSRGCSPSVVMGKETASIKNVLCPPRAYLTPKKHGKYQCSLSVEGATMLKKTWFLVHSTSLIPYLFQVRNTTLPSIFHCLWVDHVIFHPLIFYRQGWYLIYLLDSWLYISHKNQLHFLCLRCWIWFLKIIYPHVFGRMFDPFLVDSWVCVFHPRISVWWRKRDHKSEIPVFLIRAQGCVFQAKVSNDYISHLSKLSD